MSERSTLKLVILDNFVESFDVKNLNFLVVDAVVRVEVGGYQLQKESFQILLFPDHVLVEPTVKVNEFPSSVKCLTKNDSHPLDAVEVNDFLELRETL